MSVELSKQKLDIDEVAREIHGRIQKLQEAEKILLRAIEAINNDGQDILNGPGLLAQAARSIMKNAQHL